MSARVVQTEGTDYVYSPNATLGTTVITWLKPISGAVAITFGELAAAGSTNIDIVNYWTENGADAGYNLTMMGARHEIETIFNYWTGAYMVDGAWDGVKFQAYVLNGSLQVALGQDMAASYTVLVENDAVIRVQGVASDSDAGMRLDVNYTFYAGSPVIPISVRWYPTSEDITEFLQTNVGLTDFSFNIDAGEVKDATDRYYSTMNGSYGALGVIFPRVFRISTFSEVSADDSERLDYNNYNQIMALGE